jgi:hypothetical protein
MVVHWAGWGLDCRAHHCRRQAQDNAIRFEAQRSIHDLCQRLEIDERATIEVENCRLPGSSNYHQNATPVLTLRQGNAWQKKKHHGHQQNVSKFVSHDFSHNNDAFNPAREEEAAAQLLTSGFPGREDVSLQLQNRVNEAGLG